MASITLDVSGIFPESTSVGAYLATTQSAQTTVPLGTAVDTDTVTSGALTFTGLTEDETYVAIAQVGGVWTRFGFIVNTLPAPLVVDGITIAQQSSVDDLQDQIDGLSDTGDLAVLREAPLNVKDSQFGALGNDSNDDTAEIQAALTQANTATRGEVYAPPGIYRISGALSIKQGTKFYGAGSYATIFRATDASAMVKFDQSTGGGRGPRSGGWRINMAETATTGMLAQLCVNKSFDDIRIDSPAASGTAMLLEDCQNCDFEGIDLEAKGGGEGPAGTRGLVFDRGASGNNFYGFRCNEFMGPHVSYRMTNSAWSGVDKPRHNWLWGVMIERTTTSTSNGNTPYLIYHKAGDNNGIVGGNISATTDDADPGVTQTICYHDNSGDTYGSETATRMIYRDLKINGELWSGTRRSLAFDWSGTFFYGTVENCTVGNVEYMMKFNNEGSHCVRENNNFVDELATSRYTGSTAYMRANFASTTSGTINPRRGQLCYFYAGGASDLTGIDPSAVETGFVITIQFYASRTVKHDSGGAGTGSIYLSGAGDFSATSADMLRLVHDGAGNWHEVGRTVK